jgi:hypothetical protein
MRARGKVEADLRAAGVENAADVTALLREYGLMFGTSIAVTPHALAKHVEQLRKRMEGGRGGTDLSVYDDAA